MPMPQGTTAVLDPALREACDTLDAIRVMWETTRSALKLGNASLNGNGEELIAPFDQLLDGTLKVAQGLTDSWDVEGYNHCLTQGGSAIRQLLKEGPSAGGSQSFNEEHCLQIASELLRQVEINQVAFTSGGRLGRTIRVVPVQQAPKIANTPSTVPMFRFQRLAAHAKSQDIEIGRLRSEVNELRFYKSDDSAVWVWQGDGHDHPESLGCPVLIQPKALLEIINGKQALTTDDAIYALRDSLLQGRLGRKALSQSYYLAECGKCGWLGSSSEWTTSNYPDGDADASCPACGHDECDEIGTDRALELLQALVFGSAQADKDLPLQG